jgi:RND family efflux transporter MFP subunit
MKTNTIIYTLACVLLTGCAKHSKEDGHDHDHDHESLAQSSHNSPENTPDATANVTIFTLQQQQKIDFSIEPIRRRPFGPIIRTTAQVQPSQTNERIVSAQISGTVRFQNLETMEGQAVKVGQKLFLIDGNAAAEGNLSVRLAESEAEYGRAKAEYERKQALAANQLVSESDLLKSRAELAAAEAVFFNLKKNFPAGKQTVSAPIGGYITRLWVRNGQYAEQGQPVMQISDNRDLLLRAEVQARYFDALRNVKSAVIRVPDTGRTYSLEDLNGRLVSYGKSVDVDRPLLPVIFRAEGREGLMPGRFVELFIRTETDSEALVLPNEALVEEMGNYFVYIQLSPERFEKRWVEQGGTDGIFSEIRSGVTDNEAVVTRGAVFIKLAQAAGTIDLHSGHVH